MLKPALTRYRVIAYVVGVLLVVLTVFTILKYTVGGTTVDSVVGLVGAVHGFLYMLYLVLAFLLAIRARFVWWFTLLVLAAGTVPFLTFVAERAVVRRVAEIEARTPRQEAPVVSGR